MVVGGGGVGDVHVVKKVCVYSEYSVCKITHRNAFALCHLLICPKYPSLEGGRNSMPPHKEAQHLKVDPKSLRSKVVFG